MKIREFLTEANWGKAEAVHVGGKSCLANALVHCYPSTTDLRIEVDTDDCDSDYAKAWMNRIIACVNACAGIEDLSSINPS